MKTIFKTVPFCMDEKAEKTITDNNGNEIKIGIFKGIASTADIDLDGDIVLPESFRESLNKFQDRKKPIPMKFMHNPQKIIGGFPAELAFIDDRGLFVEGQINLETQLGREAFALIKQGVIQDMSVGFVPIEFKDEGENRVFTKVKLIEISPVDHPANENANITEVKSIKDIREANRFLKGMGLSNKEANILISAIKGNQRDAEDQKADGERDASDKFDALFASMEEQRVSQKLDLLLAKLGGKNERNN